MNALVVYRLKFVPLVGNSFSDASVPTTLKSYKGPSGVMSAPFRISFRCLAEANRMRMCEPRWTPRSRSIVYETRTSEGFDWSGMRPDSNFT